MEIKKITLPLNEKKIERIQAGDNILLTGYIYTARDAAHKRLFDLICSGKELPFDIQNQTIYYVGPAPAKPGYIVGPAGPTTSYRMDSYTVPLLEKGLKGMIGKGARSKEVIKAMIKYKAVYFAAVGGAAALLSKSIKSKETICYEDLGTESIQKMYIEDFPVIAVIDSTGNNLYER
jgi:fumarate hydratase subunit beta